MAMGLDGMEMGKTGEDRLRWPSTTRQGFSRRGIPLHQIRIEIILSRKPLHRKIGDRLNHVGQIGTIVPALVRAIFHIGTAVTVQPASVFIPDIVTGIAKNYRCCDRLCQRHRATILTYDIILQHVAGTLDGIKQRPHPQCRNFFAMCLQQAINVVQRHCTIMLMLVTAASRHRPTTLSANTRPRRMRVLVNGIVASTVHFSRRRNRCRISV
jgi:hypothetical protein